MIKKIIKIIIKKIFVLIFFNLPHEDIELKILKFIEYQKFFYLRFKYIRIKKIFVMPTRHVLCIDIYCKLKKILDNKNINFFLFAGCMLGAYRQGAFAGRPKDLDFMILNKDFNKLISLKEEIRKKFKLDIAKFEDKKKNLFYNYKENFWFRIYGILIDFTILYEPNEKNKNWHLLNPDFKEKIEFENFDIINPKKIKVYGNLSALIPSNVEKYLIKLFGNHWQDINLVNKGSKNFVFEKKINKVKNQNNIN
tara:strand:+ start:899 stop:1654 length:756 start_codon:yes stop_codon:yes gene_type:complete